jgi:hypothetical protein
VDGCKALFR